MPRADIRRIVVVVPARDEEAALGPTLSALRLAAEHVDLDVRTVVVANGCTDRTVEVARAGGAHVIERGAANVGAARAAGAEWALRHGAADLWLMNTDADTLVPQHWLTTHRDLADAGCDLVLGTVCLSPEDDARHPWWSEQYRVKRRHVHGANFGVRATAYEEVGGFQPLPAHEDADLARRLQAAGATTAWSDTAVVTTSGRTRSRAPAGVGADLARGAPA